LKTTQQMMGRIWPNIPETDKGSDLFRGIEILLRHTLLTHLKLLLTAGVWSVQGGTKMPNWIRPMVHLVQYPVSGSHRADVSEESMRNPTAEARRFRPS